MNSKVSLARLLPLLCLAACQSPMRSSSDDSTVGISTASYAVPVDRNAEDSWREKHTTANFKAKEGGILRIGGHLWGIEGDYDGTVGLSLPNGDTLIVPDYDQTFSPEIGFGYRGEVYAMHVTYKRFEAEGTFGGGSLDDRWNYFDIDFRQYYRTTERLQPFVTMGMGYFFGTIVDGATSDGLTFEDSDFSGISLNVGGGLAFYLSKSLALDISGIYRYAETLQAESPQSGDVRIKDGLDASGYGVSFGLTYTL